MATAAVAAGTTTAGAADVGVGSAVAEFLATRHYERERDRDLSGRNHGAVRMKGKDGTMLVACLCGRVFWAHRSIRKDVVRRDRYPTEEAYLRAFRAQLGIIATDVTPRKAKRLRGSRTAEAIPRSGSGGEA